MFGKETHLYEFGPFRLDPTKRRLLRNGDLIPLTPKAFDTLLVLVQQSGTTIEKDDLMERVWPDAAVEENNLNQNISALRKSLGDSRHESHYIATIPGLGYRFVADVKEVRPAATRGLDVEVQTTPRIATVESSAAPVAATSDVTLPESAHFPSRSTLPVEAGKTTRPRALRLALFIAVPLLLAAAVYFMFLRARGTPAPPAINSIAVLPLKPISTAHRDELYEIGIADSLIHRLSSIKGFVVRPLSATRKYADVNQDPLAAGKEQQVDYVLASNYQLADGKIRITSQLFNVASGQIEETYKSEKDASNVFAMQDALAGEVGNLLQTRFATTSSSETAKRGTSNREAYLLYMRGMYLIDKETVADSKRAIELFDAALSLDSNYAKAWAGKARAHCAYAHNGGSSPDAQFAQAKPAIQRAFDLDANLGEAYGVLAIIRADYDWDFADSEKQFLRAIQIDPNSDNFYRWYANRLAGWGRADEAITRIKTAVDINPNSVFHHIIYGRTLYFARRYDEAIRQMQRVIEMDSTRPAAYNILWRSYHMKGDQPRAHESFMMFQRLIGTKDEVLRSYESSYAKSGWQSVLLKYMEVLKANAGDVSQAYSLAVLSAVLNQRDQSFRYLNEAVKNRSLAISQLNGDPALDSLRDDARFPELVRRIQSQ